MCFFLAKVNFVHYLNPDVISIIDKKMSLFQLARANTSPKKKLKHFEIQNKTFLFK